MGRARRAEPPAQGRHRRDAIRHARRRSSGPARTRLAAMARPSAPQRERRKRTRRPPVPRWGRGATQGDAPCSAKMGRSDRRRAMRGAGKVVFERSWQLNLCDVRVGCPRRRERILGSDAKSAPRPIGRQPWVGGAQALRCHSDSQRRDMDGPPAPRTAASITPPGVSATLMCRMECRVGMQVEPAARSPTHIIDKLLEYSLYLARSGVLGSVRRDSMDCPSMVLQVDDGSAGAVPLTREGNGSDSLGAAMPTHGSAFGSPISGGPTYGGGHAAGGGRIPGRQQSAVSTMSWPVIGGGWSLVYGPAASRVQP